MPNPMLNSIFCNCAFDVGVSFNEKSSIATIFLLLVLNLLLCFGILSALTSGAKNACSRDGGTPRSCPGIWDHQYVPWVYWKEFLGVKRWVCPLCVNVDCRFFQRNRLKRHLQSYFHNLSDAAAEAILAKIVPAPVPAADPAPATQQKGPKRKEVAGKKKKHRLQFAQSVIEHSIQTGITRSVPLHDEWCSRLFGSFFVWLPLGLEFLKQKTEPKFKIEKFENFSRVTT